MEKEEVLEEIEAVEAVYGSDCQVLLDFPPHVKVSLKPRTADDLSQQFVEAILVIRANPQYPMEPPELELIDSKGLDDHQHSYLLSEIQNVAKELVSCPMLVALCEAAIERLSDMNYPAGNCSFCLFPLVMEDAQTGLRPFMKLMSCFHCFHSDCFGRWWRWVQKQNQLESISLSEATVSGFGEHGNGRVSSGSLSNLEESNVEGWHSVKCPVCCKVIRVEDVDHVRHFLGSDPLLEMNDNKSTEDDEFLSMDQEEERRKTFADIFKVQQDHGGIIEPKKLPVILPGMFLHNTVARPVEASTSSHEGISSGEEVSLGQGSVETAAAESSHIPSSSTGSLSAVGTMPTRGQTEIERLDGGRRELHIGRRGSNNNRRHFTRRSSHVWKQR